MKKSKMSGKRFVALLSTTALAVALLTGCGQAKDEAKPADDKQAAEQPATPTDDKAGAEDPLAQFPPVKLPFQVDPNTKIAEYKGGELTAGEFETFLRTISLLNPQQAQAIGAATKEMIDDYVRQYTATEILAARADEKVTATSQKQAQETYDKVKGQLVGMLGNDEAKFNKLLENHKLTKEQIIEQMTLINKSVNLLESSVTDADVKKEYDTTDKAALTTASVRHILINFEKHKPEEALKLANDLTARINKGEDMAKLAKEFTEDPGSKENGGLYADADVNQWVPEFRDAALKQKVGEVSATPVKTDYGYHVIRVEKRAVKTFEETKQQFKEIALSKKYDAFVKDELDKLVTKWNIPEVKAAAPATK
ncbi:peptidylprolyl isomerase [Brevibacillus dissolubilis]|uniref:peptidylprolyl isomerase n=1 Tax=Brevibacillus dissolubilis TaxID=1844116 RepID=UPI001116538D|nr:peptidylprolyl isomerase [Brevibacillus dissolubilis]